MSLHVTLTDATVDDLLAWLPECIAHACRAQTPSSPRPQPNELLARRIPAEPLALPGLQPARAYIGLYDGVPSRMRPPLLLLAAGLYDIPAEPDELHVAVWCGAGLPLSAAEVGQLLAEHFPRRTAPPATEWLAEQLAPLPDPLDPEPFYQGWMEQYRAGQGCYPRDSRRIFNRSIDAACQTLNRTCRH